MARISKYESPESLKSSAIIDSMLKNAQLSIEDIEAFQMRYGISNMELSRLSGHSMTQISDFKNGKIEIPERVQQHLTLLFAEFKKRFDNTNAFFEKKLIDANAFLEKTGVPDLSIIK